MSSERWKYEKCCERKWFWPLLQCDMRECDSDAQMWVFCFTAFYFSYKIWIQNLLGLIRSHAKFSIFFSKTDLGKGPFVTTSNHSCCQINQNYGFKWLQHGLLWYTVNTLTNMEALCYGKKPCKIYNYISWYHTYMLHISKYICLIKSPLK